MKKSFDIASTYCKKKSVEMSVNRGEGEDVRERLVEPHKGMEKDDKLLGVFFTLLAIR